MHLAAGIHMGRVFADNMSNEWQINQKKEKEEKRREVNNNIIKIFLLIEVYTTMYKNKKKKKIHTGNGGLGLGAGMWGPILASFSFKINFCLWMANICSSKFPVCLALTVAMEAVWPSQADFSFSAFFFNSKSFA